MAGAVVVLVIRLEPGPGAPAPTVRPASSSQELDTAPRTTPLQLDLPELEELARETAERAPAEDQGGSVELDPVEPCPDPAVKYRGYSRTQLVEAFNRVQVEVGAVHNELAVEWFRNGWDEVEIIEPGGEIKLAPTDPGPGPYPYFFAEQKTEQLGESYVTRTVEIPTGYSTELDQLKSEAGWLLATIYEGRKPSRSDIRHEFVGPQGD